MQIIPARTLADRACSKPRRETCGGVLPDVPRKRSADPIGTILRGQQPVEGKYAVWRRTEAKVRVGILGRSKRGNEQVYLLDMSAPPS